MKNYAYKLAGEIVARLLSTVFLLVLARIVGAGEFGIYSTAFAFASVFGIVVDLGTNPIITREIARYPHKRPQIIASVNFLKTITAIAMLACLWWLSLVLKWPWEKAQLIPWFGWVVIGTAFMEYLSAIFTGLEQMGMEAVLKIVTKGIVIIAALVALATTHRVFPTVKVMGLFSILSILIGTLIVRSRIGTFGFHADWKYAFALLSQSLPIFGAWAFLIIYDSQDILILNYFKLSDAEIGLFALAVKILDVLKVFPVLLASSFFPSLARHAHQSRTAFREQARRLLLYATLIFPLTALIFYVFAPFLIQTLYGKAYLDAVPALRLLLIGFLFMAFNLVLLQLLIALDKEKQSFGGSALLCLSNLVISVVLVPPFGILGACYALIGSEILFLAVQSVLLKFAYVSLTDRGPLKEIRGSP